jgi:hypothetical protein
MFIYLLVQFDSFNFIKYYPFLFYINFIAIFLIIFVLVIKRTFRIFNLIFEQRKALRFFLFPKLFYGTVHFILCIKRDVGPNAFNLDMIYLFNWAVIYVYA